MSELKQIIRQLKTYIQQSRFNDVITLVDQQLATNHPATDKVELLYLRALAQRLSKTFQPALATLTELLTLNADHARAYQEQGYIHKSLSDIQNAAIGFYQATLRNPALLASWKNLEPLYIQMGNTTAADIATQQIQYLEQLPKHLLGALDLFYEGNLYQAEQVCRQFLQHNKHHADGMILLAKIGSELKIFSDAEFLLESCIELYPDNLNARIEYCNLLIKIGKFNKSKPHSKHLLTKQPLNPAYLAAHASSLVGLGEIDNAIEIYQQLLSENQEQPSLHLLKGHALKASGRFPQAIEAYQKAYHFRASFGDAYWSLANTKTYRFSDSEIQTMEDEIQNSAIGIEDKIHIMFALGKAFEDRKNYDRAFEFYAQGNHLKHLKSGYDAGNTDQQIAAQMDYCNTSLFALHEPTGCTAPDPIFIVGLPRAGSTLLEQILASHSQVNGTMELPNILSLVARLKGQNGDYPRNLHEIDNKYLHSFGEQYLEETRAYRADAPFFIDKMPNNFMHIGLIKLILPNAKVIDARRHPMACCFSGYKQLFAEGQEFTYELASIGRYYQAYEKLMDHWDEVIPGFVLRVQHEDVIEDLENQVKRLLDFCGLPFEQNCIDFHKTERNIKTPSSEQVRQPIYRSGMAQWTHFEQHLKPLKAFFDSVE